MKDQIEEIRRLLDGIEAEHESCAPAEMAGFHAFELPVVIQEIVDDLQPLLSPYEAAFYWYAFRHSEPPRFSWRPFQLSPATLAGAS